MIRRVDDNWVEGQKGDKIGIFPISFVEVCGIVSVMSLAFQKDKLNEVHWCMSSQQIMHRKCSSRKPPVNRKLSKKFIIPNFMSVSYCM